MMPPRIHLGCRSVAPAAVFAIAALMLVAANAPAQPEAARTRRLRGIIDRDETWSGHIIITDDLDILGATVTVRPGTLIEFAHAVPGSHPALTVGSEHRQRGELILLSSSNAPITFRTRPGTNPGRIRVYVRNRTLGAAAPSAPTGRPSPPPNKPAGITWRHVRCEHLGSPRGRNPIADKAGLGEPGVAFHFVGPSHSLEIAECSFDNSTHIEIRVEDQPRLVIRNNRFRRAKERVWLAIRGSNVEVREGSIDVAENHLDAAILADGVSTRVRGNVVIGRDAAIVIRNDPSIATRIVGNYVHNTTKKDDGRYCLHSENPGAQIKDNILRGGTTCVLQGARRMSGNVLIGEPNLSNRHARRSRTHQLVAALPAGARFERNLLLGPAHALLVPQPLLIHSEPDARALTTRIRHNVFDGLHESTRAIRVNPPGHFPSRIVLVNNLFLRVASIVHSDRKASPCLTYADYNAYAPPPLRTFDRIEVPGIARGQPGWSARDVAGASVADLALTGPLPDRVPDFDADLEAGRRTIAQIREALFNRYQPRPGSPLIGAGRADSTGPTDRPRSIGGMEPAGRQ